MPVPLLLIRSHLLYEVVAACLVMISVNLNLSAQEVDAWSSVRASSGYGMLYVQAGLLVLALLVNLKLRTSRLQ